MDYRAMSKKDFIALAAAIRSIRNEKDRNQIARIVAAMCRNRNECFRKGKFYLACNYTGDQDE